MKGMPKLREYHIAENKKIKTLTLNEEMLDKFATIHLLWLCSNTCTRVNFYSIFQKRMNNRALNFFVLVVPQSECIHELQSFRLPFHYVVQTAIKMCHKIQCMSILYAI